MMKFLQRSISRNSMGNRHSESGIKPGESESTLNESVSSPRQSESRPSEPVSRPSETGSRQSESGSNQRQSESRPSEPVCRPSESGSRQSESGSNQSESDNRLNGSRTSLSKLSDSGSGQNDSGHSGSTFHHNGELSGAVAIYVYTEERDGAKEVFNETYTCENICSSMANKLGITPTMLTCFGLGLYDAALKKYYWLAPYQKPRDVSGASFQMQGNEVHFRMRFLPDQSKCLQLDEVDPHCLTYLMWQVKWDFLHSSLSCFFEDSKTDEARGFGCMLILLALRMNTEKERTNPARGNCTENLKIFMKGRNLDHFLPSALRKKLFEKKILEDSMFKKVKLLQDSNPVERCSSHYLKKWCLQVILRQNFGYYTELFVAYDLDIENEEFERIDGDDQPSQIVEKQELTVSIKVEQSSPRLTVSRKNAKLKNDHIIDCYIASVAKLEVSQIELDGNTWWKLQMFRQDGHPKGCSMKIYCAMNSADYDQSAQVFRCMFCVSRPDLVAKAESQTLMLYFKSRNEVYSFTTCVECYYRLVYDFYDSLCQEVEPSRVRELNIIRAHGPVRDEFVRKKLKKKKSKDLYVLRMSLQQYGQYDVLYLPSATAKLRKETLPKIESVEGGYIVAGSQDPPQDLKVLVTELIKDTNIVPSTCMRIKPQSEGCDVLQTLLMGQEPRDLQDEDEERRERRKIENQPKVYCKADLEIQSNTILGHGHFTEVYSGLLCGQDEVVVKQLRVKDIPKEDFRTVQEAFHEGLEKLMTLGDLQYFVGYMGMCLVPSISMVMKGTRYGSLRQFLQYREQGLPMLSLHHLLDANIQLASALVYMEEKNCYHGNLHCDNVSVMNYDNRTMVVRITDPGLVSLYNKLPLHHSVNKKRLPWIAPELQHDLTAVTAQSEVFAYGTTLWQMFSQGLNPINHDVKLKNKTEAQIIEFFANGNHLTCAQFLHEKNEDPLEIKKVKSLLFKVMKSCWNRDPQERANPKMILKDLNSNVQTYEETYHKYNIIPYFDVTSSTASYPLASSSEGTRIQSSGFINSDQPVLVPDITCLKEDRGLTESSERSGSQAAARQPVQQNLSALTTEQIRPVAAVAAVTTPGPLGPSGSLAQAKIGSGRGAIGGSPSRPSCPLPAIPTARYTVEKSSIEVDWRAELGKGHYGAVYKGKKHPTGFNPDAGPVTIVVKVLKPEMVAKYSEDFKKEAEVMQRLIHRNVVKFYGITPDGEYLVMEFVENNSLHRYVSSTKNRQNIKPETFLQLAVDISAGMEYLESQRVIHCDLAARNILLARDLCAKISDFGLSKILSQEKDYYRRSSEKTIPLLWCAPEWIGMRQRFTSKSDVWSFGVVLWEMYSYGKPPYLVKDDTRNHFSNLHQNKRLQKFDNCPVNVYDEMLNCWKWEPENRPSFESLRIRFEELSKAGAEVNGTAGPTFAAGPTSVPLSRPGPSTLPMSGPGPLAGLVSKPGPFTVPISKPEQSAVQVSRPGLPSTAGIDTPLNKPVTLTNSNVVSSPNKTLVETNENDNTAKKLPEKATKQEALDGGLAEQNNIENKLPNSISEQEERDQGTSPVEIADQSGIAKDKGIVSNQSKFSSKQGSTGSQTSSGKIKNGDQNIVIQKGDLLITSKLLGKGSFGKVYKGRFREEDVAVKECTNSAQYERFEREFILLYKLAEKSSNIVRFIGLYQKEDIGQRKECMYVMEYLEGGCLYNYLETRKREGKPVAVQQKIHILIDIAKGMDYLFKASVVHCDLTAKNVLLSKDLTAKISDFGWAKKLESTQDNVQYKRTDCLIQPFWVAPEVFKDQVYTKFSDIWSFGVVCIEVFQDAVTPSLDLPLDKLKQTSNGKPNCGNDQYLQHFYQAILKGSRFPKPPQCPDRVYENIILKCWQKEYQERILFSSIIDELAQYSTPERNESGDAQSL